MKKGRSKMTTIIISIFVIGLVGALITWGVIAYFGRKQSLTVKSIENPKDDIYLIHLSKPDDMTWKAGSYAKFELSEVKEDGQKSRWLTIASTPDENEILILTHNKGSLYKKSLTKLSVGAEIKMSWLYSNLSVKDESSAIVCFASDVGIAALRPIVKEWAGKRPIMLNHLTKGVSVFDNEIKELSNQNKALTYETSDSLSQSQESIKKAVDKYGNNAIYLLSGQEDDLKVINKFLEDKGIDSKNIKKDTFRGLK